MSSKGFLLRQRIVAAADKLFYQQGYEQTSFNDIANAVSISRGNFYYHFKSKDDILNAVLDIRLTEIRQMISNWEQSCTDPRQCIELYIDLLITNQKNIENHGCPIGSLCSELNRLNHQMQGDANKMLTLIRDWLTEKFIQLGHTENARQLAMHLLGRSQGIATITSSLDDRDFLQNEVNLLKQWLQELKS